MLFVLFSDSHFSSPHGSQQIQYHVWNNPCNRSRHREMLKLVLFCVLLYLFSDRVRVTSEPKKIMLGYQSQHYDGIYALYLGSFRCSYGSEQLIYLEGVLLNKHINTSC